MRPGLCLVPALALFNAPALAPALADDALIAEGKGVYKLFCTHCHGVDMVNPGTSSFDLRTFPTDQRDRFYDSVNNGKGDMPAWGDLITPEELDALWAYVATRGGKEPLPGGSTSGGNTSEGAAGTETGATAKGLPLDTVTEGTLTACLARNGGALSGKRHGGGSRLDYRLSEALAETLGLDLAVIWFESEPEEESDPVRETYALLAHGLCDMVPAHPLYAQAVGEPPAPNATLPR